MTDPLSDSFITVNTSQFKNERDFELFIECLENSYQSPPKVKAKAKAKKNRRRIKQRTVDFNSSNSFDQSNKTTNNDTINETTVSSDWGAEKTFNESDFGDLFKYFDEDSRLFCNSDDMVDDNNDDDAIMDVNEFKKKKVSKILKKLKYKTRKQCKVLNNKLENNNKMTVNHCCSSNDVSRGRGGSRCGGGGKWEKCDVESHEKIINFFNIKDKIKYFNAFFNQKQQQLNATDNNKENNNLLFAQNIVQKHIENKIAAIADDGDIKNSSPQSIKKQTNLKNDYGMRKNINKQLVNTSFEIKSRNTVKSSKSYSIYFPGQFGSFIPVISHHNLCKPFSNDVLPSQQTRQQPSQSCQSTEINEIEMENLIGERRNEIDSTQNYLCTNGTTEEFLTKYCDEFFVKFVDNIVACNKTNIMSNLFSLYDLINYLTYIYFEVRKFIHSFIIYQKQNKIKYIIIDFMRLQFHN